MGPPGRRAQNAPHVEAGKLRVLGVSSAQRMAQLPGVPTIAESGLAGYEHEQWYALFAPARFEFGKSGERRAAPPQRTTL